MTEATVLFGVAGVVLSLLRYATYIRAIRRGTTKPHCFTWISAAIMSGIAVGLQWVGDAGPSLWVTGVVALCCAGIGVYAAIWGERDITRSDWISFISGLAIIPAWFFTNEPLVALALVLLIELAGYYPTVRKSYMKPQEEDAFSWFLSALRWAIACLAVSNINILTLAYPLFITVFEFGFVLYLTVRKRQLAVIR